MTSFQHSAKNVRTERIERIPSSKQSLNRPLSTSIHQCRALECFDFVDWFGSTSMVYCDCVIRLAVRQLSMRKGRSSHIVLDQTIIGASLQSQVTRWDEPILVADAFEMMPFPLEMIKERVTWMSSVVQRFYMRDNWNVSYMWKDELRRHERLLRESTLSFDEVRSIVSWCLRKCKR